MIFLLIGIAGLLMKYLEVAPVAAWSWWIVMSPFALTVAWWTWADKSGYSKRVEVARMDKRKKLRIDKQREKIGMLPTKNKPRK